MDNRVELVKNKYAVIDLEMCKIPYEARKCNLTRETIQIGAVLLDENFKVEDTFVRYIAPQFGFIDNDISKLTGINRRDVCGALSMEEVLKEFINWLPNNVKIVSWSDNDERQIHREMEAKNICIDGFDILYDNWIDCQKIFGKKMHTQRCYKLSEALVAADIMYEDGAHDGLVDAYNTSLLFAKMEKEPELILNPYYQKAISNEESNNGFTIRNLLSGLDLKNLVIA